jgi:hypothetical protein
MKKRDAVIFLVGLNTVFLGLWKISGEFPFLRDYAKTSAIVVEASVKEKSFGDTAGWCPSILFRYSVGPDSFTGHRFAPKNKCGEKQYADELVARFPPGQAIEVWYDEKSPQFAVISREISISIKIAYMVTIMVWAIGSLLLVWCLIAPNSPLNRTRTDNACSS